jgi:hypothetical protein
MNFYNPHFPQLHGGLIRPALQSYSQE